MPTRGDTARWGCRGLVGGRTSTSAQRASAGSNARHVASTQRQPAPTLGPFLPSQVRVVSSSVAAGKRTVVLSRPSIGRSVQHANFSLQDLRIPFISAIGSSATFMYHRNKTASSISLWPAVGQPVCL